MNKEHIIEMNDLITTSLRLSNNLKGKPYLYKVREEEDKRDLVYNISSIRKLWIKILSEEGDKVNESNRRS